MPRTLRLLLATTAAAVTLAGCTPNEPPEPTPSPTATAVFASEEEALAAAEEVYADYRELMHLLTLEAGADPERLLAFVSQDIYERERQGLELFVKNGYVSLGEVTFTIVAQEVDLESGAIAAYVCEDLTQFDVVDRNGASVVDPGRPDLLPYEVQFAWTDALRIAQLSSWTDGGVCPSS